MNVSDVDTGTLLVHTTLGASARSLHTTLSAAESLGAHVVVYVQPFTGTFPAQTAHADVSFTTAVGPVPAIDYEYCGDSAMSWVDVTPITGATSYTAVFHQNVTGETIERTVVASLGGTFRIMNDAGPLPSDAPNWSVAVTANPSDGSPAVTAAAPKGTTCVV